MGLVAPIQRLFAPAAPPASSHFGLSPDELLRAGILGNPDDPQDALRRARGLIERGCYAEAQKLLNPHLHTRNEKLLVQITEALARCAMTGAGDWEKLLHSALKGFEKLGDKLGAARTHRHLGEMLLAAGRLDEAEAELSRAAALFEELGETAQACVVACLRACVVARAGYVRQALERIRKVIEELSKVDQGRNLALALLERARIFALSGDGSAAARDLVAAERILVAGGTAADYVRARVVRAECLVALGDEQRAASGLKRVLVDAIDLEDSTLRAWVHTMLGIALSELDPAAARQALMRGRHLYETMKLDYQVAECDVILARVEHRIGIGGRGRLKQLSESAISRWPLLIAELQMTRAEMHGEQDPERAQEALFKARDFAIETGNRALVREINGALQSSGATLDAESAQLTPVPATLGKSDALPRPTPYTISDISDRDVVVSNRPRSAVRLLPREAPKHASVTLKPPLSAGALRRA